MLDQFSERLQGVFSKLPFQKNKTITEENLDEALREIRRALLEADVNLRVIKAFINRLKDRALGANVLSSLSPEQQLVGLVNDELVDLLGKENKPLILEGKNGNPPLVVLFGLQGSGKTTTAAKLAKKLKQDGQNPMLIAADTFRPAAIKQLQTLGEQVKVPVHTLEGSTDMLAIAQTGIEAAKQQGCSVVIIDTAGRLQVDTEMMADLLLLERMFQPQEKLLVIDAMMGQEAVAVAEAFHEQLTMTGVIMTKLDGDARGGAVLSVTEITGQPIKFIGMSEKLNGLEPFHPDRMASRILGMGDVLSLVEKAQQAFDEKQAKAMEEKLRKQSFSLEDFMALQKQLKMLGSLDQILNMLPIPGITKDMKETLAFSGEKQMKRIETMINSMTPGERQQPELINASRQKRIASGSGIPEKEVTEFLKHFEQMRMVMQQFTKMTDTMKADQSGEPAPGTPGLGLSMSGGFGPKKKKAKSPFPGFPGMPKNMPKGMPKELPPGFPGMPTGGGFPKLPF